MSRGEEGERTRAPLRTGLVACCWGYIWDLSVGCCVIARLAGVRERLHSGGRAYFNVGSGRV